MSTKSDYIWVQFTDEEYERIEKEARDPTRCPQMDPKTNAPGTKLSDNNITGVMAEEAVMKVMPEFKLINRSLKDLVHSEIELSVEVKATSNPKIECLEYMDPSYINTEWNEPSNGRIKNGKKWLICVRCSRPLKKAAILGWLWNDEVSELTHPVQAKHGKGFNATQPLVYVTADKLRVF